MKIVLLSIVGVAMLATILFFYVRVVAAHLTTANAALGKPALVANAEGFFGKLNAKLFGWKTAILAWIAAASQAYALVTADVITGWKDLPWANVVDAKVANWITFACAALIPIVHSMGLAKAATTTPVDPNA